MNYALQKAIFTKLAAFAGTSSYTVVDNVSNQSLPYIRIGEGSRIEIGPCDALVYDESVQIDIFVDWNSGHVAKQMSDNVIDALRDEVLDTTSDGYTTLGFPRVALNTIIDEDDPVTGDRLRHVILEMNFKTQKN